MADFLETMDEYIVDDYYDEKILKVMKNREYITTQELETLFGMPPTAVLSKIHVLYEKEPGKWYLIPPLAHIYGKLPLEQQQTQPKRTQQQTQGQQQQTQQPKQYGYGQYQYRKYNYNFQSAYDYWKNKKEWEQKQA